MSRYCYPLLRISSLVLLLFSATSLWAEAPPNGNEADQQVNGEDPSLDLGLSEMFDVAGLADSWERSIDAMLSDYGLSASFLGSVLATVILVLLTLGITYAIKRILQQLFSRLNRLGDRVWLNQHRLSLYKRVVMAFIRLVLWGFAVIALVVVWGGSTAGLAVSERMITVFLALTRLAILILLAAAVFEAAAAVLETLFAKWARTGTARVNTLLPIVRNVTYGVLAVIFGITLISELGIDVVPLLAGAGVIGFAIGFGAQTFVKDLITGFVIILEDLIQVGDVASVGGRAGLVEKITIRKVQLRDLSGTVYTVPFSEIGIVENLTKDFSFYLMDIGVAYRENTDEVIEVLKEVSAELCADEEYKSDILDQIEILGVDSFADSAVIIKARIKTLPIKQWRVGREFNRRMKFAFDAKGIEIPFPHQTLYFGQNKDGSAPAAHLELTRVAGAANDD